MYSENRQIEEYNHHGMKVNACTVGCGLPCCMVIDVWRYLRIVTGKAYTFLSFCGMATKRTKMERIKRQVQNAIHLYERQDIPALQQQLYELYSNFNQIGGGKLIINYPNKDQLAECFTMMLRFDWMNDNEIREVWAENGFYCIIEYMNKQANTPIDMAVGALNLFLHLCVAREYLKPKVQEVLNKAVMLKNPVFKDHYIKNSADYLIDQFLYLSARMVQPLMKIHGDILQGSYKKKYDNILLNRDIEQCCKPNSIIEKASFIAAVIGTVLEDI